MTQEELLAKIDAIERKVHDLAQRDDYTPAASVEVMRLDGGPPGEIERAPELFDIAFRTVSGSVHAYVYLPCEPAYFDEHQLEWYGGGGGSGSTGYWYDLGAWSGSAIFWIAVVARQQDVSAYGDAVWRIAGKVAVFFREAPSGWIASNQHMRQIAWIESNGLMHKLAGTPIQFSSRPCDTERTGTTGTNKRSISKQKYNVPVLQLYGFDDPTTADNPWASDTPPTGVTNSDWMLVLRRVKSNGDVEIQYMPLAQVAGSPDGNGQPTGGGIEEAPEDGKNYGRRNGEWQDLNGEYWPQGGDESTCYGSGIGDAYGVQAIDLDNHQLKGIGTESWSAEDQFSTGSEMFVGTDLVIKSASGAVCFGADRYSPKTITYIGTDGRTHTETVLAQVDLS